MKKRRGFQPSFCISNGVTAGLTRIERARGFLDAAKLSEDWLATMRSRALLLEAHHTTHIEGCGCESGFDYGQRRHKLARIQAVMRTCDKLATELATNSPHDSRHVCAKLAP